MDTHVHRQALPRSLQSELLRKTCDLALEFVDGLNTRPVGPPVDPAALLSSVGAMLPVEGEEPGQVVQHLSQAVERGLVATAGPRYFGFVIGGSVPAAIGADWLTSVWDQNAFSFVTSPAAAAVEETVRVWLIDLFGLAPETSLGFTTGCTMSNFTALAAARHALLRRQDWNVEERGLTGAPAFAVVTSEESHVSIFAALQMLGLGRGRAIKVATDEQGRMNPGELARILEKSTGPALVCAQAGNVNTGAFDPIGEIAECVRRHGGWLHVDGAFGMWAVASPHRRALLNGIELADSVAVDCHKWLNVPYDSGLVFVRDAMAHHAAMTLNAPYYVLSPETARDNSNWVAESSRRARGFTVYAALRSLGRRGLENLIERSCALAKRMSDRLGANAGVQILNDVVLNQVLVRFTPPSSSDDPNDWTMEVIRRVQETGTCWVGGTTWHNLRAMRISVSNWSTTEADIDISAEAILNAHRAG
jgi:glutamate/tyrosine decarboxylase-like PLP-dependent enzyme